MTDQATIENIPMELGPRSSVLEKTTPELRRKLDRAIVNYDPPGYLALYKKYGLTELGVSYHAFYHYARKLRRRAALRETTRADLPDEQEVVYAMPTFVGQYLIDQIMANDQAAPNAIYRLMLAYTAALNNAIRVRQATHIFPRTPSLCEGQAQGGVDSHVASGASAGRQTESEPRPSGSAEYHTNTVDAPPLPMVCASAVPNPVNPVNPVPSPPPIPHSEFLIPTSSHPVNLVNPVPSPAPANLCSSPPSAEKPSEALIPLATMRRSIPRSQISNPEMSNNPHVLPSLKSADPNLGALDESPDSHQPGELPKLPLLKQDFPDPDPQREALRLRVRAAYGLTERPRESHWIDPEIIAEYDLSPNAPDDQLSPDQLRRRDLRRALLAFGVLSETRRGGKPDAPAPDSS